MWDHAILAEANRRQSLLYAGSFLPGAKIFFLFVLGDVLYLLGGTYQALVIAANQLRFHVIQNITGTAGHDLIAWLTIPRLGMTGAAVATIIAQVLLFASTSAFLAFALRRPTRRTYDRCHGLSARGARGGRSSGCSGLTIFPAWPGPRGDDRDRRHRGAGVIPVQRRLASGGSTDLWGPHPYRPAVLGKRSGPTRISGVARPCDRYRFDSVCRVDR